ncbi:MAG TPA: hypothetical protein VGN63_07560 [Flavisolibacter sp.]|jgi:hypothetical protein|nr:hypothetical protein [Flavisolibacter sp.]
MNAIFGVNNSVIGYLLVLAVYGLMFLLIRFSKPKLELNYRANFFFLFGLWAFLMFTGNYLFYRLGVMAFLPWMNNLVHSVIWVGVCLSWLYYCTHERPLWEQFILFAFTSFIVKMAEYMLLGTWNLDRYFGIESPYAYIFAMSIVDGFYPIISRWVIRAMAKRSTFGVYVPA